MSDEYYTLEDAVKDLASLKIKFDKKLDEVMQMINYGKRK